MNFILRQIPDYLVEKLNVLRQISFTALFALVFINIYSPFDAESWFNAKQGELFLYSSLFILAGMMVIVISRMIFIRIGNSFRINYLIYIFWTLAEIFVLAFTYTILEIFMLGNEENALELYFRLLVVTIFVLAIPYSLSWLYYSWQDQKRKLLELSKETSSEYSLRNMINFYDETDKLRFSLSADNVLYIESTDNYVTVYVQDKERIKKVMLRNTMKRLEIELEKTMFRRCHRSYMVNFQNVKMVRLVGTTLYIYIDATEEIKIPVSRTYVEKVHETINQLSL
ncbi:LytTR family transcriptional regulator DNA-binding domain-containing protein [Bacteroidota bacterium]